MKVMYLLDTFPKRSETFVREEATWMAKHDQLAGLFAFSVDGTLLAEVEKPVRERMTECGFRYIGRAERVRLMGYWLARIPLRFLSILCTVSYKTKFSMHFWNAAAIAQRFSDRHVGLIHVHFAGEAAQCARFISLLTGIPFTLCVHGYDVFYIPPSNYPDLAKDASAIVTISDYNCRYLITNHGVPANKMRVIHCGIDLEKFTNDQLRLSQPEGHAPVILSVGRLVEVKAHKDLVAACAILAETGVRFKLKLIGDGDLREALELQIATLGLTKSVEVMGDQPTDVVLAELNRADIFAMPSLSEGIPVALMEAMATELAVVATRVRGVPELVSHGENGLLVAAQSPQQLAQALITLIGDADYRRRLGRSARVTVSDRFSADTQYEKLLAMWTDLASRRYKAAMH